MRPFLRIALASCLTVCAIGCGPNENEKDLFATSKDATPEEKAKPPRDYPTSQDEYNQHLAPKGPPGSYSKNYPFAKGQNKKMLDQGEDPSKQPKQP